MSHDLYLPVNGITLHAVAAGPVNGPLVVLLHGFPEFWYGWQHQIPALAEAGFRVLALDQRGYNLSEKPRRVRDYCLDLLAADVAAVIAAQGRQRAFVVGHDWGGMAAWWTAVRFPERVERLAILNCPHPLVMRKELRTNPAQRKRMSYIFLFQLPFLPERWVARHDFLQLRKGLKGTARKGNFSAEQMARYRAAWSQPGAVRGMLQWYRAAFRAPPAHVPSARIRPPTLLLWGEKDRFLGRELVDPTLATCDHAELETFPEATHWVQHEEAAAVNARLLRYFRP